MRHSEKEDTVDCDSVRKALAIERDLTPDESAHLDECAECGVHALGHPPEGASVAGVALEKLLAATESAVERDARGLRRLRSLATPYRTLAAFGVAVLASVATLVITPRPDLEEYPAPRMLLAVTSLALLMLVSTRLALHPLQATPLPVGRRVGVVAASIALALGLALLPAAHWSAEVARAGIGSDWAARALSCFSFGLVLGAPLFIALRLFDRSERASGSGVWLAAGAAGLLGNLALQLHCPLTHSAHLLAGHVTVILVAVALPAMLLHVRRPPA